MDKEQLQQKIAEYFGKLPKEAQDVFSSMKWMETLNNIGVEFHLNPNQIETLGTETTLVLLGITHIEEYQSILESELKLQAEVTEKIIQEIDDKILTTIKGQLVESFKSNAISLAEEKYGGEKKLDERFASLPKEVQIAIRESDYQTTLYTIASKYKLSVEQMGALEEVTTKVMLGIIHPDKYESELSVKLNIPEDDVSNLVKDVNEEILKTIREILKSHWDKGELEKLEDDDVPLPPYANIITNYKLPITDKKNGAQNTELNEQPKSNYTNNFIVNIKKKEEEKIPVPIPTPEPVLVPATEITTPIFKKEELTIPSKVEMGGIPKNIMEEKLKGATVSEHTVSVHTAPDADVPLSPTAKTVSISDSTKNPHDPYREII